MKRTPRRTEAKTIANAWATRQRGSRRALVLAAFAAVAAACATAPTDEGPSYGGRRGDAGAGANATDAGGLVDATWPGIDANVEGGGGDGDDDASSSDDDWYVTPAALAPRPPMGWNSWNAFGCNVSESLLESMADAIASSGLKAAGYEYVNIDDCWQTARDAAGNIVADPNTFPHGIKGVADYVHGKGLKLGVYSDRGTQTCAGRPGAQGYEAADAKSYAAWGVDYLKEDNCNVSLDMKTQYQTMEAALQASGRPVVLSICAWAFQEFMPVTGQLWRTTGDVSASWGSVTGNLDTNADLAAYAHPGAWNDPDMLEVGNSGITDEEGRSHFALWAMMASPLIAGNDVRSMTAATQATLTSSDVIAVDQDPLGYQGAKVRDEGDIEVWAKPMQGGGVRAVALSNRSGSAATIHVSWSEIGLADGAAKVRDLWTQTDLGPQTDGYEVQVASHATAMLRVNGAEPALPTGTVAVSALRWTYAANGFGPVEKNTSNGEANAGDGKPITIKGHVYATGLGTHGGSLVRYRLGGRCTRFASDVGVDDESGNKGSVRFQVWADGTKLYDGPTLTGGTAAAHVDVDVTGKRELKLVVTNAEDGKDNDHADWGEPTLTCSP